MLQYDIFKYQSAWLLDDDVNRLLQLLITITLYVCRIENTNMLLVLDFILST